MTSRRALPALLLVLPLLAGCAVLGGSGRSDALYPDLTEAKASADGARIPDLVPADARSIRVAHRDDEDGQVLSFTSKEGLAGECEEDAAQGSPAFEPGWWPADELPRDGWRCGDWTVVLDGTRYLAWT